MADQEVKIGVYVAADAEVSETFDMDALEKVAKNEAKVAVYRTHENMASDAALEMIQTDIAEEGLNHIVIMDRSVRAYPAGHFDFGEDVMVDVFPMKELVVWSLDEDSDDEDKDWIIGDYLRMFAAKTKGLTLPEAHTLEVERTVLVIGGGVAGLRSALNASASGVKVVLVEKEDKLGGWSARSKVSFPTRPPYDKLVEPSVHELIRRVQEDGNIDVRLSSRVLKIAGQPGEFEVNIQNGGAPETLKAGSIIQATGWLPYNPEKLDHLGYGLPNVLTNVQLERMFLKGDVVRPSDGKAPESIAFIQCAGSRDKDHLPYCSAVCCRASLKHAMQLREMYPDAKIYVLYKDIRSPGQYELFYQAAQDDEGFFFTKGEVVNVEQKGNGLSIDLDETLLGEPITVEADMLVLAAGMVPTTSVADEVFDEKWADEDKPDAPVIPVAGEEESAEEAKEELKEGQMADGKKEAAGAEQGARILNLAYRQGTDLPTLKYGFPDSHFICFPYETRRTAIFAAGTVRAPMDTAQSQMDANGASLKAVQALEMIKEGETLHPRSRDLSFPDFFLQRCTQCKRCTEDCPFGALDEDVKGTPQPNIARCRRCGTCMGACPERIINFQNYSVPMGNNMIKGIEVPEEFEEKPRILAFMCENDALPALEVAAQKRMKINKYIRIIPVRCLGSVNLVWITNCLDAGIDGIMLLGCKHGDDYQCHFVRGSELAEYRMDNVQEKLKQMMLEEERVRVEAVAIDEWDRVVTLLNDYAEEIEEIGPNPFKM